MERKQTFKIPLYWKDLFEKLDHKEVGIIMMCIFSYHSGDLVKQGEAIRQLYTISEQGVKVHDICLQDIRYQDTHKWAYRKPEDVTAIRNSKEYKEWRTEVFRRDNYTCQNCGVIGGELNAHHIKPFSRFPAFRFDVDNGITLCKKCHKLAHKRGFKYA